MTAAPLAPVHSGLARWLVLAAVALGVSCEARGQDIIHFKSGAPPATGRIEVLAGSLIKLRTELQSAAGSGTSVRDIDASLVDWIDFALPPEEEALLASASVASIPALQKLWAGQQPRLPRPRSATARLGLALAAASLKEGGRAAAERALGICNTIEKAAWAPQDRSQARAGRLRALMALGRVADAEAEAAQTASETKDVPLLLEARFIQAGALRSKLDAWVKDHPRWQDDPEAARERSRLLHEALDLCLWPALFHGSEEAAAARGLWLAAEVHSEHGQPAQARQCAEDITRLYPAAAEAVRARKLLDGEPAASKAGGAARRDDN